MILYARNGDGLSRLRFIKRRPVEVVLSSHLGGNIKGTLVMYKFRSVRVRSCEQISEVINIACRLDRTRLSTSSFRTPPSPVGDGLELAKDLLRGCRNNDLTLSRQVQPSGQKKN